MKHLLRKYNIYLVAVTLGSIGGFFLTSLDANSNWAVRSNLKASFANPILKSPEKRMPTAVEAHLKLNAAQDEQAGSAAAEKGATEIEAVETFLNDSQK